MRSVFLIVVIVGCEILGANMSLAEPALNRSFEFEVLDHGATPHHVFASSLRGSKRRCAAGCAKDTACTQFCYEPTTKQCLLEDAAVEAASEDVGETADYTCYTITSVCTNTFTSGTYLNHVFPFPAFDGEFVLDFAVQINADAIVSLSVDDTHAGINYEVGTYEQRLEYFVLGKYGNTLTVIRRKWDKGDLIGIPAEADGVVSGDEMRRFWLRYDHGTFALGKHERAAYLEWTDPTPPADTPRFIGLGGWADVSHWIIYNRCS
ncbi:uncharacterized protein LOC119732400 [Patiria miniata]|uniref:Farnesoic acid O-methyl transferase domain-containing protein n=1 Tax=Patiria miniata TaxID=46514 RepID=A0A914AEA7_PATMI|nr:uncharacterized protein LOC119732400 [Patiria miniata]